MWVLKHLLTPKVNTKTHVSVQISDVIHRASITCISQHRLDGEFFFLLFLEIF